jgi:hypothetical protein
VPIVHPWLTIAAVVAGVVVALTLAGWLGGVSRRRRPA